jgi:hypothetical protein
MHHPTGHSAAAHRPMVDSRGQAGSPPACGTPSRRTLPPRGTCLRRPTSIPATQRADQVCASVCTRAPAMPCSMILAADRGLCMCGRGWTVTSDRSGDGQADLCGDRLA